jgi:DNA-binding NarL/FixJ family response regulator
VLPKTRIFIIDDHPLFREGLKSVIARSARYEVVGEAGTGRQGFEMVKELKPELVLVDISLPDQNGLELTRDILRISPKIRIMIVSTHSKIDYIVRAFQAGASGYVVKESAAEKLLDGMESVLKGDYFMDTSVSRQMVIKLAGMSESQKVSTVSNNHCLTAREQEILKLLAEGMSTGIVAVKLFISQKTVENHRSNIMHKLGLHSTIELIRYAAKTGLIDLTDWKES